MEKESGEGQKKNRAGTKNAIDLVNVILIDV